jgi:very-short-patch-repair endonuclease
MPSQRPACDPELTRRARELRRNMTEPERRLRFALRDRRLVGWKFRRQAVLGSFIVDYFCQAANLVIEIDGDSHAGRAHRDCARQAWLESQGLRVIRISNDDVLHEIESVVEGIVRLLNSPGGPETDSNSC